jgi:CheY-like chemotaxis protein
MAAPRTSTQFPEQSMSNGIQLRYSVALEGFSAFERSAIGSFFRLAAQRAPAYVEAADLAEADFVIADGDQPAAVQRIVQAGRLGDTVFVGAHAPAGAGACVARPIAPTRLARELDQLLERRLAVAEHPVANANGKPVLVVDDSRIAQRYLQMNLRALGYRVQLARTAIEALRLLSAQPFSLVFLDAVLDPAASGADGFALCQHIRRRASHPGGVVPGVVMVTSLTGSADRVRGTLAGCDAYLTKPLAMDAFRRTLRQLDPDFVDAA